MLVSFGETKNAKTALKNQVIISILHLENPIMFKTDKILTLDFRRIATL
jgi:hypothetical protein